MDKELAERLIKVLEEIAYNTKKTNSLLDDHERKLDQIIEEQKNLIKSIDDIYKLIDSHIE
jgi:DNA topoisomerase IA